MREFPEAKLRAYISMLAPHNRDRGGQLLLACDMHIKQLQRGCHRLQQELLAGGKLDEQNDAWWLFAKGGDGVAGAATLFDLLLALGEGD